MGGQIDQPDALHVAIRAGGEFGDPLCQWLRQLYRVVGGQMGKHFPRERLGDGAEPEQRVAVRRSAARARPFAKTPDRYLAVSHGADADTRNLALVEEALARELAPPPEQGSRAARPQADPAHPATSR